MYRRKKVRGKPYIFQEFAFYSPQQFDKLVPIEEKDFLFKIKVCVNSNRVFTGPFLDETVGEYEITIRELNKMLEIVNETKGLIIYGFEYTITDDFNGLWKYYGTEEDVPMAVILKEELVED